LIGTRRQRAKGREEYKQQAASFELQAASKYRLKAESRKQYTSARQRRFKLQAASLKQYTSSRQRRLKTKN
jgi:hypothetical protein